jgi:uncharacterized protein
MTVLGILLALLGPPIVALVGPRLVAAVGTVLGSIIGLGGMVAIVASVFIIAVRFEHQTLASLGFQPLRWQSLAFGLGLAAFFMYAFTPAIVWVLSRLPFGGFETGLAKASAIPTWLLVITVLIVATAEEILYRGYAVERLAGITGSYWIAGAISVLVFGAAHIPNWGLGAAMTTLISGAILTVFYIWQRDLTANIIAHVVTDFMGLIVMPALAQSKAT